MLLSSVISSLPLLSTIFLLPLSSLAAVFSYYQEVERPLVRHAPTHLVPDCPPLLHAVLRTPHGPRAHLAGVFGHHAANLKGAKQTIDHDQKSYLNFNCG